MKAVALYPVYHSVHDTFHWVKTFVDRDFHYHRAVAQVWIQLGLVMADSPILPFNCSRFAQKLKGYTEKLAKDYGQKLLGQNITLGKLYHKLFARCQSKAEYISYIMDIVLIGPVSWYVWILM